MATVASPGLDRYQAVANFRFALRAFLRSTEDVTRANGLTPGHYDLLVMIKAAGSRGATVSGLAERLSLAANSATELVDRAQEQGLVSRRPDPEDGRVTRVVVTKRGDRRVAATLVELHPQRLQLLELLSEAGEQLRPSSRISGKRHDAKDDRGVSGAG